MTRIFINIALLWLPFVSVASAQDTIVTDSEVIIGQPYTEDVAYEKPEAAGPPPAAKYANRKFENNFKENYTNSDFDYEVKKEKDKNWLERMIEWLVNAWNSFWEMLTPSNKDTKLTIDIILFRVVSILLLLVVVYFVVRYTMKSKGVWIFGRGNRRLGSNVNELDNIHETDFASLIGKTAEENSYRLAIRFYYLWILKKLSANGHIHWNQDKTNTDYYYEIKNIQLRDDFKYLSYVYDYIWYGEFEVDNEAYLKAEKAFRKTLNTL